jgi:DNA recombination protein RmuC
MDLWLIIIVLAAGLLAGGLGGWLLASRRETVLREKTARIEADLENERRATEEKIRLLAEAEKNLRDAFKALSAESLRESQKTFLELASHSMEKLQKSAVEDLESRRKAVDELVKPIEESLGKVDQKLQDVEKDRTSAYAALMQQVEGMSKAQRDLHEETSRLVQALRTPSVRGQWGEIQLKRVVEMAGMLDHCDFQEQEIAQTDQGRLQPDMVVHLPGGKNVVVDAKAPLSA